MSDDAELKESCGTFDLDRCKAFTDGVVAIIITLLILGIDIPKEHRFSEQGLVSFLREISYDVLVYGVSFWLAGTYWVQHSAIFHCLRGGTRVLFWLNLLFLFPMTMLPFVTKLKGMYRGEVLVVLLFGGVQTLIGLCLLALWIYAIRHQELLARPIEPAVQRSMIVRMTISPILISLAAMALSFLNVRLGTILLLTVPLFYFSHRLVDGYWAGLNAKAEKMQRIKNQ